LQPWLRVKSAKKYSPNGPARTFRCKRTIDNLILDSGRQFVYSTLTSTRRDTNPIRVQGRALQRRSPFDP
jgi:hypothetical protein